MLAVREHCPQDLATLEVSECNLVVEVPPALAAHLPRNLQALQLRYVTEVWHMAGYEASAYSAQQACQRCCMKP